jgi:hypothetical protein
MKASLTGFSIPDNLLNSLNNSNTPMHCLRNEGKLDHNNYGYERKYGRLVLSVLHTHTIGLYTATVNCGQHHVDSVDKLMYNSKCMVKAVVG